MPQYLSPGVYVEEVPPVARPIAGVGTSTAGFIGVVPDKIPVPDAAVVNEALKQEPGSPTVFNLDKYPVQTTAGTFEIRVNGLPVQATLANDDTNRKSKATLQSAPPNNAAITGDYIVRNYAISMAAREVKLCTSFSEFTKFFGSFSTDLHHRQLAHAIFGFFNNGGTRCYVVRITSDSDIDTVLDKFATFDEIAIVAMPGFVEETLQEKVIDHCEKLQDRFAVLDGAQNPSEFTKDKIQGNTKDSSYAAIYFPWIKVSDPIEKLLNPQGDGTIFVPPSGHIAGAYAQVDTDRGVHKAPGNVVLRGALDVQHRLTKADQDGLNPKGINVIRPFNGNIKLWGARTMGGDDNGEFKYVSTRRFFNFLRESIDEGTQFVVFEPNSPALWERIKRSVGDFLLNQWRAGALFGETPAQAFFVRCDRDTNPPEVREAGQVVTVIGVAIVKPAEFVIFRIQQTTGG
jgi:phage tail sheath protein FI